MTLPFYRSGFLSIKNRFPLLIPIGIISAHASFLIPPFLIVFSQCKRVLTTLEDLRLSPLPLSHFFFGKTPLLKYSFPPPRFFDLFPGSNLFFVGSIRPSGSRFHFIFDLSPSFLSDDPADIPDIEILHIKDYFSVLFFLEHNHGAFSKEDN